jgi:DNA-binding PadR family transcriptional regulator
MAQRKEAQKLPTTSYIILGLLTFQEMSGYDLKLLADRSVKYFYWSPTKSQIYSELRRLESHGLVTMREVIQERRPDKRIYTITPAGRQAIQKWLVQTDIKPDTYKSQLLLKLFFGSMASPPSLISLVEERQQELKEFLSWCKDKRQELQDQIEESPKEKTLVFPLYTLDHTIGKAQADLVWTEVTLQELRQRQQETA